MDKNNNDLIEALVIFSNLAIPPNDKVEKGLGDLLGLEDPYKFKIEAELLIEKYEKIFNLIYKFAKKEKRTYEEILEKIYNLYETHKFKLFLDEFRVFAIKKYFSNKYVIKKLGFFDSRNYDNVEIDKDNAILNSLITNDQ